MRGRTIGLLMLGTLAMGCSRSATVSEIRSDREEVANAPDVVAAEGDWPWWRGPATDGHSDEGNPPIRWSQGENIVWRADVAGRGHSSPIVCDDRIYLTTADEDAETQLIVCYDRATGDQLWETVAHEGDLPKMHRKNSHASATPAGDGERVLAVFIHGDALHVTAVSQDGEILWQEEAGPFGSEHGYGSSPVLYKSLVIVCGDNMDGSYLAALDRQSGEVVWRTPRERPGWHGSYGTPAVFTLAGRPQLLLTGHGKVSSYDPDSGELIWSCDGPAEVTACTVAATDELVFASGGYPEKELLAIRPDGKGDVTQTHVAWRKRKGVCYVPSPLVVDGHLYVVSDNGIATCFAAETGQQVWRKRLGGAFSASPVLAGGKLYIPNEAGKVFVLEAGSDYRLIAQNDLADGGFATPVICAGRIYLRTNRSLYCIAEEAPPAVGGG